MSKSRLARLTPRIASLDSIRKPWAASAVTPKRMTGRPLQARNHRIKVRDQWTCQSCGRITDALEIDHRVPISLGGSDDDANLQALCAGEDGCHDRKSKAERNEARGGR